MHHGVMGDPSFFISSPLFAVPFVGFALLVAIWALGWKGLALWHAARRGEYWWFIALLLINTLGILEMIYLFFFAKRRIDTLFTSNEHKHHHE